MPNVLSQWLDQAGTGAQNALSQLAQGIQNQWQQGEPYRISLGALLSGDPSTAKKVIEQRFANTTPQDIYQGALNTGLSMAPIGMIGSIKELPYQIEHKPMTIEGGASPLHDLSNSFDESIYSKEALQNYGSGDPREKRVLQILKSVKDNPDAKVTIYRGAPESAGGINPGDWVTLHPQVAQDYVDLAHENEGIPSKVYSMEVPASHVTAWPDSLLEQGYYPQ